jgi:hypothetical protein
MQNWVIFTPQLKAIIILISSPLTMSAALWGMTSHRDMQSMRNRNPSSLPTLTERETLEQRRDSSIDE